MRYIVIGAGAIGGTIGGRLAAAGHEVVLVARGTHLDALRARGLSLAAPEGTSTLDIPAIGSPGELDLREDDVLLLATKTQDAEPLLAEWAWQPVRNSTVAADALPVVCAQNGVASERIALRRFRQVYGMCVWLPATHLEPGVVEANGAPLAGLLHIGRYPSGAGATAEQIGADLTASGFLAPVTADVMRWKYGKLLANLSNATEAVCGHDAWRHATELRRRVTAEGRAVLDAAAHRLRPRTGERRAPRRPGADPAGQRGRTSRRFVLAEPDSRHRVDRGRLPQRGDRPARPRARRADPAERGAAAAGQPGRPGPPGPRERHAGRGHGPGGAPGRRRVAQNPAGCLTSTTWMRPGSSWPISRIFPT